MAYQLPVECPICRDVLEPDRTLEHHLVRRHTQEEIVRYVASQQDRGDEIDDDRSGSSSPST